MRPWRLAGPAKGDEGGLTGDEILHLNCIPHGVNIGDGGFHPFVHQNASFQPQRQPGIPRQLCVRRNANGEHHKVCGQGLPILQQNMQAAVCGLKTRHRVPQQKAHPVLAQLCVKKCRHFFIQGRQHLGHLLYNRYLQPALAQVFGQLQPNEATADQHGRTRAVLPDECVNLEGILHSAQREQPLGLHARKVGPHGAGARGKQQLIIRVFKHAPVARLRTVTALRCG